MIFIFFIPEIVVYFILIIIFESVREADYTFSGLEFDSTAIILIIVCTVVAVALLLLTVHICEQVIELLDWPVGVISILIWLLTTLYYSLLNMCNFHVGNIFETCLLLGIPFISGINYAITVNICLRKGIDDILKVFIILLITTLMPFVAMLAYNIFCGNSVNLFALL